jgi:hypothetical protein
VTTEVWADPALPGLVWTRGQVARLVTRWFGVVLSLVTIGKYLRSWGLSPQKPIRKAYEQNPEAVTRWLEETYPAITSQARRDGGVVLWLDQTGLRSDNAVGVTWAPVGRTPVVGKAGVRFEANAMAAISNKGELYFTVYHGSLTTEIMTRFFDRLTRHLPHCGCLPLSLVWLSHGMPCSWCTAPGHWI